MLVTVLYKTVLPVLQQNSNKFVPCWKISQDIARRPSSSVRPKQFRYLAPSSLPNLLNDHNTYLLTLKIRVLS